MVDLANGLENWLDSVEKSANLSATKKAKVTGAGAAVFAEVLKKNTPVSGEDYLSGRSVGHTNAKHGKKPRKTKHLRDSITYRPGINHDKLPTGDTAVGFDSKYSALVGRFVNNGVRNMSAKQVKNMHFFDRSQTEARTSILKAEAEGMKHL